MSEHVPYEQIHREAKQLREIENRGSSRASQASSSNGLSPIEKMIDTACGVNKECPLTDDQKELCAQLGRSVLADLRFYYPDVVKTRPTTWPVHLRNSTTRLAEVMLLDALDEKPQ